MGSCPALRTCRLKDWSLGAEEVAGPIPKLLGDASHGLLPCTMDLPSERLEDALQLGTLQRICSYSHSSAAMELQVCFSVTSTSSQHAWQHECILCLC